MNKESTNWLSHPSYFIFVFLLGCLSLSFSFNSPSENEEAAQFSSEAELDTDFNAKLKALEEENANRIVDENKPFVMTPEEVEQFEKTIEGNLSEETDVSTKPQDEFTYEPISSEDLSYLVSYEDPKICGDDRNYIEKTLTGNTKISEWTAERSQESSYFPRKCVAFALNSFPEVTTKKDAITFKQSKITAMGRCPHGATGVLDLDKKGDRVKHGIPCISKNFVNLTYNTYADVTACLNLDPKELFPKIYNESGFFMNALGSGKDGGIGQLTQPAIDQVNSIYPRYIEQMIKSAELKPNGACARIMKYKHLIAPVKSDVKERCSLMWPNENPLRNLVYTAMLSKYNSKVVAGISYLAGADVVLNGDQQVAISGQATDELGGHLKDYEIRKKLAQLGLKKVNLHQFKSMLVLAGYNSGISTAMNAFNNYLDQRIQANLKTKSSKYNLTFEDFNFESTKDLVKDARNYIMSSFIKPKEPIKSKIEKIKRRKQLPAVWASAFAKTFPEYMALRMNSYAGGNSSKYEIYGFPGYVTALMTKNKMVRDTFQAGGIDPNYCTTENFLKFK